MPLLQLLGFAFYFVFILSPLSLLGRGAVVTLLCVVKESEGLFSKHSTLALDRQLWGHEVTKTNKIQTKPVKTSNPVMREIHSDCF